MDRRHWCLSGDHAGARLLLLSLLLWITTSRVEATDCGFSAIFNFGDSNSDTGGLAAAWVGTLPYPNGITFFNTSFAGRFCDGRLVIDFIAEELGFPYLHAFLQSLGSNFAAGANFATAGSTVRAYNSDLGYSPFSLDKQIIQFGEFKQRTLAYYKPDQPGYFEKALYTLDIGQNDLTALFDSNLTISQVKAKIPQVVEALGTDVKVLYEQGARNFLFSKTGPLGCLPYILTGLPHTPSDVDEYGCAEPYNVVAEVYNAQLEAKVEELKQDLATATFVVADIYSLKRSLFVNGLKEGFEATAKACCGFGGGLYNYNKTVFCGSSIAVNGTQLTYNLCTRPSAYVIWDGAHYTEAANRVIAHGLLSGDFSSPSFQAGHFCDLYPR